MRPALIALTLFFLTSPALAQRASPEVQAAIDALNAESRCYDFPGPEEGTQRPVCVWWPKNASGAALPVLYMADGMLGLYAAAIELRPVVERGAVAPFMIVAVAPRPEPEKRADEYWMDRSAHAFETHETWLIEKVIPWAEKTKRASNERDKRFIGGFSNGADLAWALANRHPDTFGGALIHSPAGAKVSWVGERAGTQRWVITGGTEELPGSIKRGGQLPRDIAHALANRAAPARVCIGRWGHEFRYWRQLSPGSITWLLKLGKPDDAQSVFESGQCENKEQY